MRELFSCLSTPVKTLKSVFKVFDIDQQGDIFFLIVLLVLEERQKRTLTAGQM